MEVAIDWRLQNSLNEIFSRKQEAPLAKESEDVTGGPESQVEEAIPLEVRVILE